jgi:hypothetical protein
MGQGSSSRFTETSANFYEGEAGEEAKKNLANYYKINPKLNKQSRFKAALEAKAANLNRQVRENVRKKIEELNKELVKMAKKAATEIFYDQNLYTNIMTIMEKPIKTLHVDGYYIDKEISNSKKQSYVLLIVKHFEIQPGPTVVLKIRVNPGYEAATSFDTLLPYLEFSPMKDSYKNDQIWIEGPDYKKYQNSSMLTGTRKSFTSSLGLQGGYRKKYNKSKRTRKTRKHSL